MNTHIARAQLLLEHSRYKSAEEELRQGIAMSPENPWAHSLLALSLSKQGKQQPALQEARLAVSLAPNFSFSYFMMAMVLNQIDRIDEAKFSIEKAIQIDPEDADYYALLSQIYLQKSDWEYALKAAEEGLRINPEDIECTNLRAIALVQLGRREEAGQTIDHALAREPDNAMTHANQGWTLLHRGKHEKAMEHFREALRLDPMSDWAKGGIVEALKAQNPIYRIMLKYFLWMSRLSTKAQWMVIIGAYLFYRFINGLASSTPGLRLILVPLMILYLLFVSLTWIAQPLFNLLLRLNRFGRLALSREQLIASNWVGACILVGLMMLVASILFSNGALIIGAMKSVAMILPISGLFQAPSGKSRAILTTYTILLGVVGMGGLVLSLTGLPSPGTLDILFLWGWVLYSWIANIVITTS